jgi:UDP-N-acetylmuramate: L-alanyl-gamma-D-glutamyl-meso-diaminopimelate ligase
MPGKAALHENIDQLADTMAAGARAGDIWIIMSQGGFGGLHQKFLTALSQRQ